ncbi:hypothetical protein BTR23_11270 [Alkalihalophilus pseudofirmus]|nr:hypothetical protein BTR23_11270 [Alkalihalophilus pseudofirmus]
MKMRKGRLTEKRKKELLRGLYIKPMLFFFLLFIVVAQITGGTSALFNDVETIKESIYVPIWEDEDEEWDKSSLEFLKGSTSYGYKKETDSVFATVMNSGDEDMKGNSEFELYYIVNSNNMNPQKFIDVFGEANVTQREVGQGKDKDKGPPTQYQILVYQGEIPQLVKDHKAVLSVMLVELENELGEKKLELLLEDKNGEFKFKGYHRPGHGNNDEIRKVIWSENIKVSNIEDRNNVQVQKSSTLEEDQTNEVIKVEDKSEKTEPKKEDTVGTDTQELEEKIQNEDATNKKKGEGKEEDDTAKEEAIEDSNKKELKANISSAKVEEEVQSDKDKKEDES